MKSRISHSDSPHIHHYHYSLPLHEAYTMVNNSPAKRALDEIIFDLCTTTRIRGLINESSKYESPSLNFPYFLTNLSGEIAHQIKRTRCCFVQGLINSYSDVT